jgi:hypothetical protein
MASVDPSRDKHKSAKSKSTEILSRLGLKDVQLTEYEGDTHRIFFSAADPSHKHSLVG